MTYFIIQSCEHHAHAAILFRDTNLFFSFYHQTKRQQCSHIFKVYTFYQMAFQPKTKVQERKFASRINSNHVRSMGEVFDMIFEAFQPNFGKLLSKKERSEKQLYDTSLIYGEIDYESFGEKEWWYRIDYFIEICQLLRLSSSSNTNLLFHFLPGMALQKIVDVYGKPDVGASGEEGVLQCRGGMFYDLGSGVGKAVIGKWGRGRGRGAK